MLTKKTEIWTKPGCTTCEKVKEVIGAGNYEEHPAEALLDGLEMNLDAMVQLAQQNMELPIIMCDGQFISPEDLLSPLHHSVELELCHGNACKL
ncbi:MAG: hypothetical protein JXA52_02195 [Planctomycetes bacterium]|nr:hypothetical protein [Planctomycetota bacterium]